VIARQNQQSTSAPKKVRCAIYTRKSTEEGLDQEFNSLDAQRESAVAYIASQKADGWTCVPERYDDGGFTGGNIERPALQRLLADITAGSIDCVVVYKVDRLSRSLLDFTRIMETFERHGVSFVSVTQAFNTRDSMGRLMLNVLLSFAQFEREIIGERIRDKIGAQRRKGKWAGGKPMLGYDVDRSGASPKLVINAEEASRVRTVFELYIEKGSLLPVVEELERRGWLTKAWVTKAGQKLGGRAFDRPSLHQLLTNPILAGRIVHKGQQFAGEHEAIVSEALFSKVQRQLHSNGRAGTRPDRGTSVGGAMLRGRMRCRACDCAMVHVLAGKGTKRYRYYVCSKANRTSRANCPGSSMPAAEIERVVLEQLATAMRLPGPMAAITEIACNATQGVVRESEVWAALKDFESLWASLSPKEQSRVLDLVIERIDYDAGDSSIEVILRESVLGNTDTESLEVAA
jgi:site-specific DNA recombinase